MKKLRNNLKLLYEKRMKKKQKRKAQLNGHNAKPHEETKSNAPRWMRRKRALVGTSYWRGDRDVLEDYFTRGCQ